MCEFHDCNCNGLGDIWWTDKCMYFSSIDKHPFTLNFFEYFGDLAAVILLFLCLKGKI